MANPEHLALLKQDVDAWNTWRRLNSDGVPDLSGAVLDGADLSEANLYGATLFGASLYRAYLRGADLATADLEGANLDSANLLTANLVRTHLTLANFRGANLAHVTLSGANLFGANLGAADLSGADLDAANLAHANLGGADLSGAFLDRANLLAANLSSAVLCHSSLTGANLTSANLEDADLTDVYVAETVFANVDLSQTQGLDTCNHLGASILDHRTLQKSSGQLPLSFLRGCGLPDNLIKALPSLFNQPIRFYSCFISYSSKDDEFARRLHADLQNHGVRCWFAPEDMKIGDHLTEAVDSAVRSRDKLLLILSEASVASAWVHKEVETALAEEDQHRRRVLFPIRLDDAVTETTEQWAYKLRHRYIGDFLHWRDQDAYSEAFKRLLRDLKVEPEG
jgi:uncharacterized protein YjbI with pentapeptide repeats